MSLIDADYVVALLESKQKELCPLGRFGRGYVYGSDRDEFDRWQDLIDTVELMAHVDVEPLVRCKDCVHRIPLRRLKEITGEELYKCFITSCAHKPDFFCADGKPGEGMKR